QVLDDGRLTDNKGRVVNFKNTIIIMTSNIGSHIIQDGISEMNDSNREHILERIRIDVMNLLRQTIRPEFLNRVDEIIMFNPLSAKDVRDIVRMQFNLIKKQMSEQSITIDISDAAVDWLAENGYDPHYGARPIKRLMQKHLLNELSRQIIADRISKNDHVLVDSFGEGLVLRKINAPVTQ
ncbi:MAG TPA: AAA family ATPase, partial [Bacteroidales bacterium]|nr:AAA family ATPase [Bacteroidales bacterium]